MRLTDLDARFIGGWHERGYSVLDSVEGAQGVMFQCPLCAEACEPGEEDGRRFVHGAHYIICWFRNPRNAPRVPDDADPKPGRWNFEGDTIDALTFTGPEAASVLLTSGCRWHGFVRNGETSTC